MEMDGQMEVAAGLSSFIIARILLSMTAEIDEFKDARRVIDPVFSLG